MTMARFASGEQHGGTARSGPAWLVFIWEVNDVRPDTFGRPLDSATAPPDRAGYQTEHYPTARVVHGPGEEGVRVIADDAETAAAFRTAAQRLGIHIGPSEDPTDSA